jgi:uncharacterized MnhB-related membrane protein
MDMILLILTVICALQSIRARSLLAAAAWLAGTSALVAILLYGLGAPEVAVIELSVGAGLVTVLFVFATSVAGEEAIQAPALIRKPVAWALTAGVMLLLAVYMWQGTLPPAPAQAATPLPVVFWELRGIDVLLQLVLIFTAVLTVLALLVTKPTTVEEAEILRERSLLAGNGQRQEEPQAAPREPVLEPESEVAPGW